MLPDGFEPKGTKKGVAPLIEWEVPTMNIGSGFGMEMIFDHGGEGFTHIPLSLVGREGSVGQRPPVLRKRAKYLLWQFGRHIQYKSHQDLIRLPYQTISRRQGQKARKNPAGFVCGQLRRKSVHATQLVVRDPADKRLFILRSKGTEDKSLCFDHR